MRFRNFMFFTFILFCVSLFAQEKSIAENDWNSVVDYSNTKVTLVYIDNLLKTSKQTEDEISYFNNTLKLKLSESSLENPISFDSLSVLMNPKFERTFKNLSFKINSVKNEPNDIDSLFNLIKTVLVEVKKEELYDSEALMKLREEVHQFTISQSSEVTEDIVPSVVINQARTSDRGNSIFSLSNIIILTLFILWMVFLFRSIKKGKKIRKLGNKIENLKKSQSNNTYADINSNKIKRLEREKTELLKENMLLQNKIKENHKSDSQRNASDNTVTWQKLDQPKLNNLSKPKNFYSGKPNSNREFNQITQEAEDQETVFKFTYTDNTQTTAEFEVVIVSEFMKRQIINAPDDFLYRVCNNVNSNQEFQRDIITERKGKAVFSNGVWIVDENDQALIKFQ